MARRFYIVGIPGSGKTIAARLGIAHVELAALFHGPNWSLPPAGEFERRVAAALDGLDDWVVDGNYRSRVGGHVLEHATTIVWLDLPLHVCIARVWRRTRRRSSHRAISIPSAKCPSQYGSTFFGISPQWFV